MEKEFYLIGSKKKVMGGMRYFGGKSNDGFVFKDEKAFKSHKGICYIAECEFGESGDSIKITPNNTYDLICSGGVSTYDSIIKEVEEQCNDNNIPHNGDFINFIAECVFDIVDWQCISTYLNEIDIEEEYQSWLDKDK